MLAEAWDDSASDDSGAIDFADEALGMDESSDDDEIVGLSGVRVSDMRDAGKRAKMDAWDVAEDDESEESEEGERRKPTESRVKKDRVVEREMKETKEKKKKKKKNRMGQRERQKLLEQQYGREAKHVKKKLRREGKERKDKRKRKERGEADGEPRKRHRHDEGSAPRSSARGAPAGPHHAKTPDGESVHPSWAAAQERKRKQKEMEKVSFAGKKITFE